MNSLALRLSVLVFLILAYGMYVFSGKHYVERVELTRSPENISSDYSDYRESVPETPLSEQTVVTRVDTPLSLDTNNSVSTKKTSSIPVTIEVFGRIVDVYNRPIDDTLISEEVNFTSVRSDANGEYRIEITKPEFKYPFLSFLRSGYTANRIGFEKAEIDKAEPIRLDVTLKEASNTTTVTGWIGNENGLGLGNLKILIKSKSGQDFRNIYYGIYSDDNGDFSFDGVLANLIYRFEVLPSESYPQFIENNFFVSNNTPHTKIVLKKLNFIRLSGIIMNSIGMSVPNFEFKVNNLTTNTHMAQIKSDASGYFQLDSFPSGDIKLTTRAPDYFKIEGVKLPEYGDQELQLIVDVGNHFLAGWVGDESGNAVVNARVTLDAEIQHGAQKSISYRSRLSDSAGSFKFENVGPESHVITVYAKGYDKKEIEHEFDSSVSEVRLILTETR